MHWLNWIWIGLAGLLTGRFLNTLIHRLPRGESPWRPFHSQCPYCKGKIGARDTVPIVSFFLLRRQCRVCNAPISARYPLVEGMMAVLFVVCYAHFSLGWALLAACVLCTLLVACSFVDWEHQMVLDELLIAALVCAAALNVFFSALCPWWDMLLGIAAGAAPLLLIALVGKKIAGRPVMGGGDIKFMGVVGAFLGWQGALMSTLLGSIAGGLLCVVLMLARKVGRGQEVPFVPMLATGALLSLFFAQPLMQWYTGLFF